MPKQVDFYIFPKATTLSLWQGVCRQIEKIYQQQKKIYVQVASFAEAETMDQLLWTYSDEIFLPHQLFQSRGYPSPIQIGYQETMTNTFFDLLINISNTLPTFFSEFDHMMEIIFPDDNSQQRGRERYKFYREQQFLLHTYKLETHDL